MKYLRLFCLICLVVLISQTMVNAATVVIYPEEYPIALRNPLMGFRPNTSAGSTYSGEPYATVTRCYIRWNEIENDESDTIDKIKTVCNTMWRDAEKYNVKVIPRVYLDWDSASGNEYWPADMTAGDYTSEQFKTRLRRLIQRLGQCWNNDPRVAWVQMGIIGWWGEQETPWPTAEIQQLMGDEFTAAFPNKKVIVRRPADAFTAYPFGGYLDSWANWGKETTDGAAADYLNTTQARWKVNVWEGESAYNCCDYQIQPGDSPDDTMKDPVHLNFMIDTIRKRHCSALGWVSGYTKSDPLAAAGAEEVQRAFGYRYLLDEVTYPDTLTPGAGFSVQFKVTNVGSTPFYHNWPVEISLLNPSTKAVVWHDTFDGCDIRNWMPGDQYNSTTRVYTVPAVVNTVTGTFQLPAGFAAGEYILALAILDPAGMLPSARFSTVNYFNGGRHPIGYTGVNVTPSQTQLSSGLFNDPASDRSLYYSLTGAPLSLSSDGTVQAESYTAMSGIQTQTTSDVGGGLNIGWIENGDWAEYTITIVSAGSYPVDFRVASGSSGGTINMVIGGSTVGSVAVTNTGGTQSWTTVSTTATFSTAGTQTLRLNFVGGTGYLYNINWFKIIGNADITAPAIPTGLVATAGQGFVSLDWADTAASDLWVYGVYRATISGGPYTHVQDVFTSDWVDYGVTSGTTYYYVVTAMDKFSNESGYSSQSSAMLQEPAAPAGLTATAGNGSVSLNWADNTEPDLASYNVKRATVTGGPYTTIATGVAVSAYTDNTVTNGTTYYYVVSAVDTGSNESVNSSQVSATPHVSSASFIEVGGRVVMEAEHYDNLRPSQDGGNVSWVLRNDAANYLEGPTSNGEYLYVGANSINGNYTPFSQSVLNNAPRADFNVEFTTGGTYYIWVCGNQNPGNSLYLVADFNLTAAAPTGAGNWVWWNDDQFLTPVAQVTLTAGEHTISLYQREADCGVDKIILTHDAGFVPTGFGPDETLGITPPAAPSGLTATAGNGSVSLDWADNTEPDLAGYNVKRATVSGGPYTTIASNVAVSAYTDNTVTNGTTYYYVVSAVDTASNESGNSGEVSATPNPINLPPTVSITTPLNGQSFPAGSNINVAATASDTDGTIANVKLYRNGQFVRQENTAPYEWGASDPLLQNLSEGSYVLEAVATDNLGATASHSITIYVIAPPAAPVGLTATAGSSSVSLDWADNTEPDLASYNVKRSTVSGGPYTTIATGVAVSAYTDNTVTNGTTYYYVVSAVDTGSNESVNSSQVSATPLASAPTFVAAGAVASGTGTITPALPSGIASGDILLLFAETSNQAISISNSNGGTWAQVTNSPQGTGTAAATSATRLTVFWSRYNGTQGAPTLSDSGNHQIGRMIAIRGAAASGNPWDVTAGGVEATSDTSGSIPGATTTVSNTLVVVAAAGSLPDATGTSNFSAWTNANLTSLTERIDNTQNPGNGGALGIATGVKATAGAYGNTAVTHASAANKAMLSIAIKP
jgi:fibronectin type 3 domain-containing protein